MGGSWSRATAASYRHRLAPATSRVVVKKAQRHCEFPELVFPDVRVVPTDRAGLTRFVGRVFLQCELRAGDDSAPLRLQPSSPCEKRTHEHVNPTCAGAVRHQNANALHGSSCSLCSILVLYFEFIAAEAAAQAGTKVSRRGSRRSTRVGARPTKRNYTWGTRQWLGSTFSSLWLACNFAYTLFSF